MEEAAAMGAKGARESDFAVNLETTDKDGTHKIEGVPLSKIGKDFLAKFGISTGDDDSEGGGDGGAGDGKSGKTEGAGGGNSGPPQLRTLFGPKQNKAG
jgi:hypothetical protein